MTNIDRLQALLAAVGLREVKFLSRGERQRLAQECERVLRDCIHADAIEATKPGGVLTLLQRGERSQ